MTKLAIEYVVIVVAGAALVAAVSWLTGCAPLTRYNYEVRGGLVAADLDAATDALTNALDSAGLIKADTARDLIASHMYIVRGVDQPIACGDAQACLEVRKRTAAGMLDDRVITIMRSPSECIARTAFTHELTHGLLMDVLPPEIGAGGVWVADGDASHTQRPAWWKAQENADVAFARERCQ